MWSQIIERNVTVREKIHMDFEVYEKAGNLNS